MSSIVNFAWDANPVSDNVTDYTLNRGTQTGIYTTSRSMGLTTSGFDVVDVSGTYFWALTAQNAQGISPPSNEISEFVNVPVPAPPGPCRIVVG